jgi:ribose/xylose/arabinose/galactoside ABC-type transport system permease subunit
MDLDNMLLLLKQSAPIGIIAIGMTVVMINGNIDLSVGATYALAGIVMLDSMNWPIMEAMGDARSRWPGSSRCSPAVSGADQRRDRLEDRGRCLHRHAGRDAGLPRPRVHV